jgi:ribosomal protein S18 acetylase RimI-like enzyme
MDEVLADADRNMLELWAGLAWAAGGQRRDDGGVVLLSTGLPIPMFNPAFVLDAPGGEAAAALLDRVRAHYVDLGLPFALYFRDATAPGLGPACEAAGLVEHWRAPLMVLDPIPPGAVTVDGLAIEAVDGSTYDEYLHTLCDGFGMPYERMAPVLGPKSLDIPGFTGLLGRVDGVAAAASAVYVSGSTAGVYNVATRPDHRRRGYGEAVTAAAARFGAEAGATRAILQASEAGEPVYRRMGYATPDRYRQFEG